MKRRMTKREIIESITPYDSCFIKVHELEQLKTQYKVCSEPIAQSSPAGSAGLVPAVSVSTSTDEVKEEVKE